MSVELEFRRTCIAIELTFCRVEFDGLDTCVIFQDGVQIWAQPHDMHHYHVIAHRCGYGDNVNSYCREHEFCHAFLAERLHRRVSPVLWAMAHGWDNLSDGECAAEEIVVQTFQRFLRANERPIVGGIDWDGLKRDALALLSAEHRGRP